MSHILVVEDDALVAAIFEKTLVRLGDHAVTVTEDVGLALTLVRERQVQLVIMDVALSRSRYQDEAIDGIAFTRLIRAASDPAPVPVLLVTAHAMPGDAERLLAASGADAYLSKPLPRPGLLIERVQALLRPVGSAAA